MKQLQLQTDHYIALHTAFKKRKVDEGKSASHITSVGNLSKEFLHFLEARNTIAIQKVTQADIDAYFNYLQQRKNKKRLGGLSDAYLTKPLWTKVP